MPSPIRKAKMLVNIVEPKLQNKIKYGTKGDGTLYCTHCPNFSTLSQDALNYHVAKKHCVPRLSITYKCKLCHAEFPGFYALRQHKNTQLGTQIGFGASNFDVEEIVGDVDGQSLREEFDLANTF